MARLLGLPRGEEIVLRTVGERLTVGSHAGYLFRVRAHRTHRRHARRIHAGVARPIGFASIGNGCSLAARAVSPAVIKRYSTRSSAKPKNRRTPSALHVPPRGVAYPFAWRPAASLASVLAPPWRCSTMTGKKAFAPSEPPQLAWQPRTRSSPVGARQASGYAPLKRRAHRACAVRCALSRFGQKNGLHAAIKNSSSRPRRNLLPAQRKFQRPAKVLGISMQHALDPTQQDKYACVDDK